MSEHFWESVQRARKEYFCDECCNYIQPGDTYHRVVWIPRKGSFHVMRRHDDPSCSLNLSDLMNAEMMAEEKAAVAVTMVVIEEVVEVLKMTRDGKTVTEREIRRVPKLVYGEPEKEASTQFFDPIDDIDEPF
ncbi:MAG: hypothetical protein WAW92_02990 [Minisyncoccia bacterium]